MKWNLVGSIYGRSSPKIAHFVPIHQQTCPPQAVLVSDWSISKKSSSLKPLGQMNRNLVWSILGMSSIKNAHLVPIRWQTWPPQTILVSGCLISKKWSPLKPLCQMNRNLVGSILGRSFIKIAHFVPIHKQTWPQQAILLSGWSISKNLLLCNCIAKWTETWWEAPIWKVWCIKFPQSRKKGERHRLRPLSL
jgi:hypothetical protein